MGGKPLAEVDAIQERDFTPPDSQPDAQAEARLVTETPEDNAPADQPEERTDTAVSVTVEQGNEGAYVQALSAANHHQLPEERD